MYNFSQTQMLVAGVFCALIVIVVPKPVSHGQQRRQIPCNHPLRLTMPDLFTHCETLCAYSDWTSWELIQHNVSTTKCYSGRRYVQQRTRTTLSVVGDSADCSELSETRTLCYLTTEERFIISLGLGGTDQDIEVDSFKPQSSNNANAVHPLSTSAHDNDAHSIRQSRDSNEVYGNGNRCPRLNSTGNVCQELSDSRGRKRSTGEYHQTNNEKFSTTDDHVGDSGNILKDSSTPISFEWKTYDSYFRQRRETQCGNDDTQYVLFILDSSGSIEQDDFIKMKEAVAKLVPLFCKKIETALISFSSNIKLEYCFDCFRNTIYGRKEASEAIKQAEYLGDYTYTAATARCVCENILDSSCGISSTPECLDVIFITDGRSNDPTLQICEEIKCLHNKAGVNTYAIGIGGYDPNELECIDNSSDKFGMFEYQTFQKFYESIENVYELIYNATAYEHNYMSCATRDRSFSPTGSLLELKLN